MMQFEALQVARVVAMSHVLLLTGLVVVRARNWDRIYAFMFGTGTIASLLLPILLETDAPVYLKLPAYILQIGVSFWFWLFALAVRDPNFKPGLPHWSVLVLKIVVTLAWSVGPGQRLAVSLGADERMLVRAIVPAAFSLALTFAGVIAAGSRLGDELDDQSRRLRKLLVYWGGGASVLTVLILGVLRGPRLEPIGSWLLLLMTVAICFSLHVLLIRGISLGTGRQAARPEAGPGSEGPASAADRELAGRIETCFREDEYFREEGLTVAQLASHLSEKQYRVRRAINQVLGYRNFNAFVNGYRIAAAKRLLLEDREMPVLRLSLDLGYRSLAGFNKAFKEDTGRTPTEFRRGAISTGEKSPEKTD